MIELASASKEDDPFEITTNSQERTAIVDIDELQGMGDASEKVLSLSDVCEIDHFYPLNDAARRRQSQQMQPCRAGRL